MHIMAPKNKWELADMMKYAVSFEGPIAIRYPRGEAYDGLEEYRQPIAYGKAEWIYQEKENQSMKRQSWMQREHIPCLLQWKKMF